MTRNTPPKTNFGLLLCVFALLGAMGVPAAAQEACGGFGWPLETELSWMTSSEAEAAETGATLAALPAKAIALKLRPSKQVTLPVKSGAKKQAIAPDSYSGWFAIAGLPKSGLYQITLSHEGWIDAVQNGELLQSKAFTGKRECKAVRKSVRYELGAAPLTIQISGAPEETIEVAVREAE